MCEQVEPIQRAIDFIEAHLQEEITLPQIASAAGYSLFHFMRMFNRMVHHTPYDYLMRRRLSEAARQLASTPRRITDISQDYCFNNLETFSRAFRRMFDMQPSQWRENRLDDFRRLMPAKTTDDLYFTSREDFCYPELVEMGEMKLAGLMTALEEDPSAHHTQRARILEDLQALPGASTQNIYLVTSYVEPWRGKAYLFAGVESGIEDGEQSGMVSKTIPSGSFVCTDVSGELSATALRYMYHTWLPKTDLRLLHRIEVERMNLEEPDRVKVYLPVAALEASKGKGRE
jgi:AraC family transcriptional regulator